MSSAKNTDKTTLLPLDGKVAIVSGSSSGIGAAIAQKLSLRGAHVVINYPFETEKQKAEKVLKSLEGAAKAITVEADLSTPTGPSKLVEAAVAQFGSIDILVNNAGIAVPIVLQNATDDAFHTIWDSVMNLNARGTILLTRAVLKHLSPKNSRIINISSATSRNPEPNMSIYAGSKGMIESFTRCWARDLPRRYGCTVNTVAPGPVDTESLQAAPPHALESAMQTCKSTPVAPRMATPSEIAWTVAMLCEEGAGWLNGLYIPVTGGSTLN
jgi:3-oxoacyl-[acyl-carrier protein] reductase